jgi:hypothetical protein
MSQKTYTHRELLNIQKLVVLVEEDVYNDWVLHLQSSNALLSVRLIETIRRRGFDFHSSEELCESIYQKPASEARASFNQLTAHTLRLSEYLALNYPSYLMHNMIRIEKLISDRKLSEAAQLAQILLDLAEKIEDHATRMHVLRFLIQEEHIYRHPLRAEQYHTQLVEAKANDNLLEEIYYILRHEYSMTNHTREKDIKEINKTLQHLSQYHSHGSKSISLLSRYVFIYIKHYYRGRLGQAENSVEELNTFEKDMLNYSYVLMPYLFDIQTSYSLIKLTSPGSDLNSREGTTDVAALRKHYSIVRYWQSYLNIPETNLIIVRGQLLLSRYSHMIHHSGYPQMLPRDIQDQIRENAEDGLRILGQHEGSVAYQDMIMNLRVMTGAMYIMQAGDNIRQGINMIEIAITTFQQVKKSRSVGIPYMVLLMGYFALKDYKKCLLTYSRYLKVSKDKDIFREIEITIHTYYLMSKWLLEQDSTALKEIKTQYAALLAEEEGTLAQRTIEDMAQYFDLRKQLGIK